MTPERAASLLRMFAPFAVGAACIVYGLVRDETAMIALGAGAIGLPGFAKAASS
jgi:hypothetical protein